MARKKRDTVVYEFSAKKLTWFSFSGVIGQDLTTNKLVIIADSVTPLKKYPPDRESEG